MNDADRERLEDILEAITMIDRYGRSDRASFENDPMMQDAIVHRIMIIGEAANALTIELRERYPAVPWPQMIAMRHIVVHDYGRIDLDVVWSTVESDISMLREHITTILTESR